MPELAEEKKPQAAVDHDDGDNETPSYNLEGRMDHLQDYPSGFECREDREDQECREDHP